MSASAAGRAAQGAVKENRLPRRSSREPFRYMIRLLTVIGARPQIIKAAALSRAISGEFSGVVEEHILHTGQHYDDNMSRVFFNELGIPAPYRNLNVGSAPHGVQTAEMIVGIAMIPSSSDAASQERPYVTSNASLRKGTSTTSPKNPYTTDGIPAKTSQIGLRMLRYLEGATSEM